jgi:short-subunit dehydrogenase
VEVTGKTVLLTGATGGIGRVIAATLAGRGAAILLSARKADELAALAASLPGDGHRAIVADLAEEGAARRLAAAAGAVDVLVANAALPASGRLEGFSLDELSRAVRVNLEAPIQLAHELVPPMRERGSGHLLFVSSLAGKVATSRSSVYSATKFGLRGFALALREDLCGTGVGVSLVLPGFVRDAGMFADSGARLPAGVGTVTPTRVADAVVDAIAANRAEVAVAPLPQRLAVEVAHRRPQLAARIARVHSSRVADAIARGQADKR